MLRALAIFALIVALGWNFRQFWTSPPESFFKPTPTTADVPKANVYMLNTDTRQFSEQGQLAYRLTSQRTEHFTQDQRFILESPNITSFQSDSPPWNLSADHGLVEKNGESIQLTDNVVGHRFEQQRPVTLHTPALLFIPEKQYAQSDKDVTITLPGAETSGVGFEANLKTGEYQLLSRVKGQLDATAPSKKDK
ncbi:MAG: LPS export ABC transporter periplasmic protein LptC [Porticoccaceae bacterium]|nr:LPS export ABC transporter periplasmic protein LptC [Porticoccaceae bacterium]